VRPDLKKLQPIRNWKRLIMVKGTWSLLGLANFYWKFTKKICRWQNHFWIS
jgi:hypothetical protein